MRILIWQESFWPNIGGAEVMATRLLLALRECGHECTVVTRDDRLEHPTADRYNGFPIHRFPFWTVLAHGDVGKIMNLRHSVAMLKRAFAPELVHVNCFGPSSFFHLDTLSAHPSPLLLTLHSEENLAARSLARKVLCSADWVVACSASLLRFARQLAPEITSRSAVIYNGLEAPGLSPSPLPTGPPRLLCVGRVVADKRFDLALSAFASLVSRFSGMRLIVAGDGPARAELERQALQLGVRDSVDFLGWVAPDVVPSLINGATIIMMPSQHEAFPLVALEASLMARPVVATRVGGLPEIIVHGETGLLVKCEDCGALAHAVAFLLDHPHRAAQMGDAARERVLRTFSFRRHVNAYQTLYAQIVERRRAKDAFPRLAVR